MAVLVLISIVGDNGGIADGSIGPIGAVNELQLRSEASSVIADHTLHRGFLLHFSLHLYMMLMIFAS